MAMDVPARSCSRGCVAPGRRWGAMHWAWSRARRSQRYTHTSWRVATENGACSMPRVTCDTRRASHVWAAPRYYSEPERAAEPHWHVSPGRCAQIPPRMHGFHLHDAHARRVYGARLHRSARHAGQIMSPSLSEKRVRPRGPLLVAHNQFVLHVQQG